MAGVHLLRDGAVVKFNGGSGSRYGQLDVLPCLEVFWDRKPHPGVGANVKFWRWFRYVEVWWGE